MSKKEIVIEDVSTNKTNTLSIIDENRIEELKIKASELTPDSILNLGSSAREEISSAADVFLDNVRTSDIDTLGSTLMDVTKEIRKIDINQLSSAEPKTGIAKFLNKLPGFRKISYNVQNLFEKYDDVSGNIDKITTSLRHGQVNAIKDNVSLNVMRETSLKNIEKIEEDILIAEFKLKELSDTLTLMHNNPEDYEDINIVETQQFLDSLERQLTDLHLTRANMLQSLNDIRIIRNGNDIMIQKINTAVTNTIPIWKNMMAIGVSLARQHVAVEKLNSFQEQTNEMLIQKAEMVKSNVTKIARANERMSIDYETLKKVHVELQETMEEINKIQIEGKKKREESTHNLKLLIDEMNKTVIDNGTRLMSENKVDEK